MGGREGETEGGRERWREGESEGGKERGDQTSEQMHDQPRKGKEGKRGNGDDRGWIKSASELALS